MRKFVDKSKIGWEYATIVELLRDRALHQPESEAFTLDFLQKSGNREQGTAPFALLGETPRSQWLGNRKKN
jgi:hypothetical protein